MSEVFHSITPHIAVTDAPKAIDFYRRAFGADELYRNLSPDGTVLHCEMLLGDSRFFLSDECPAIGVFAPPSIGGSPVTLHLYVDDVDAAMARAVEAGAEVTIPAWDFYCGVRYGCLQDPFGHIWGVFAQVEDLSPAELEQRGDAFAASEKGRAFLQGIPHAGQHGRGGFERTALPFLHLQEPESSTPS